MNNINIGRKTLGAKVLFQIIYKLRIIAVLIMTVAFFIGGTSAVANADSTPDFKKIDNLVNIRMKALEIPGVSIGIVRGDKIIYVKGYGKLNDKDAVTPNTPFILGSISKSFTAVAIMQLVEKGKIDLDMPVKKYIPWFRLSDKEASDTITVRDLLSHISGISSNIEVTNDDEYIEQYVRNPKNMPLSKPVEVDFQYSNSNYVILGEIIQEVSGIPYEKYIQQNIFNPLGMNNSFTSQKEAIKDGLAKGHNVIFGFMEPTGQANHKAYIPAGYLISSAENMCHYLIAEMNHGKYNNISILSSDSIEQTHKPSSALAIFYGMGWVVGTDMIYHDGATENFSSYMSILTDTNYGIIVLYNSRDVLMDHILGDKGYLSIPNGIIDIIRGKDINPSAKPNMNSTYLLIDIILIFLTAFIIWRISRLITWKSRIINNLFNIPLNIVSLLIFNLLLPLAILVIYPQYANTTWGDIMLMIPGLGHYVFFFGLILFIVGLVKVILMLTFILRRSRQTGLVNNWKL